ncbi:His/Gly/Thr/Pro-type tRNA ligase C-terminal domain-containing protein, partial [Pradoshia sp.]
IGDQEQENGQVNVRKYGEQKSEVMPFGDFLELIKVELK